MAQNSKIEWCNHTVNLWWGCTKVHEGCDHCYAETLSNRWGNDVWGNDKPRKEIKKSFVLLSQLNEIAKSKKEIHRVFVGSMMDIFEKPMPMIDSKGEKLSFTTGDLRDAFFNKLPDYRNLLFLLLTKRPSNINKYILESWKENPPANVMFGTSPVNQSTCDTLIPQLLKVKGKRFLSVEPQLENVFIPLFDDKGEKTQPISWVIQGGESGHHRRPFNLDWAYCMKEQCKAADVSYFFKQIDKVQPIPEDLMIRQFPNP